MQPLHELVNGIRILEPFLLKHDFHFEQYENGKGSGGQFTNASFRNGSKQFQIGYRFSIGFVVYSFNDLSVTHEYYLDKLGYSNIKNFPDFQSEDKLQSFRNILKDFELIVSDYFVGDCKKLIAISALQKDDRDRLQQLSHDKYYNDVDLKIVESARQEFKIKNYAKCLKLYSTIKRSKLLTDFDLKLIEICKHKLAA